jgi:uncharacterized protein YjbI with pentapeptide repeats
VICGASGARGQAQNAKPNLNNQATLARIQTERAQAEFYREQTRQLRRVQQTDKAKPLPPVWDSLLANPGSALTALVALVAALFTFATFWVNYHATLRRERESQFGEALKRSGDTDSLAVRASAANQLAQMGASTEGARFWRNFKPRWVKMQSPKNPYFEAALNQLLVALHLESNPVVMEALGRALVQLGQSDKVPAANALADLNRRLQADVVASLAMLHLIDRLDNKDSPEPTYWWSLLFCRRAAVCLSWKPFMVNTLLNRQKSGYFDVLVAQNSSRYDVLSNEKKEALRQELPAQLAIEAKRIAISGELLAQVLSYRPVLRRRWFHIFSQAKWIKTFDNRAHSRIKTIQVALMSRIWPAEKSSTYRSRELRLDEILLLDVSILGANLPDASLRAAQLQEVFLLACHLPEANLSQSQLQNSKVLGTNLRGASLEQTCWQGSEIWSSQLQGASLKNADLSAMTGEWMQKSISDLQTTSLHDCHLEGADLRVSRCEDLRIRKSKIDDETQIPSQWWKADFARQWSIDEPEPDVALLEQFFESARPEVFSLQPVQLDGFLAQCHSSTHDFFKRKAQNINEEAQPPSTN